MPKYSFEDSPRRSWKHLAGVPLELELRPGHAAELIVRVAQERQADLIMLGDMGLFLRNYLLGSTADWVAEHADCQVMIVK